MKAKMYKIAVVMFVLTFFLVGCGDSTETTVQSSAGGKENIAGSFDATINVNTDMKSDDKFSLTSRYVGKGTVIKDQDDNTYSIRFPYLEDSSSEPSEKLLKMCSVQIDEDSVVEKGLKDGAFIDVSAHCIEGTDGHAVFVIDECANANFEYLEEIYNSANNITTFPTKKSFDDFRRYGENGSMCKISTHIESTDDHGYICETKYVVEDSAFFYIYDELNGKAHVRILPDDHITALCRFDHIESDGTPVFILDYLLKNSDVNIDTQKATTNESPNNVSSSTGTAVTSTPIDNSNDSWKYVGDDLYPDWSSDTEIGDYIPPEHYASDAEHCVATTDNVVITSDAGYANIRSNPSTDSQVKFTYENGRTLDYLGDSIQDGDRTWYHVGYYVWNGDNPVYQDGWISSNVSVLY